MKCCSSKNRVESSSGQGEVLFTYWEFPHQSARKKKISSYAILKALLILTNSYNNFYNDHYSHFTDEQTVAKRG